MDRQFTLRKKLYLSLEKDKKKIKGIELAFNFINLFLEKLPDIVKNSCCDNCKNIKIYDYNNNKTLEVSVNVNLFQTHFQFLYRQFVDEFYFTNFSWYNKFSQNIVNLLRDEFNYTSFHSMQIVIRMLSTAFVVLSNSNNEYSYNSVIEHLTTVFCYADLSYTESRDFSISLIKSLEIYELIFFNDSLFGHNKFFSLSDSHMDTVFFINSMFIPLVYEDGIKYNSCVGLTKLSDTISWFCDNLSNSFKNFDTSINVLDMIDFYNIDSNNTDVHFDSPDIKKLENFLYSNTILLNEFVFHTIAISCFDFYCTRINLKNVLHNYKKYDYYLNP